MGGRSDWTRPKVATIQDYKIPRTKKDVRVFLGLTGYYRRFIPGYAALSDQKKMCPTQSNGMKALNMTFNS